jgi:ribosome-associated toxin RatA of RatAB toxin-antitoxin module
MLMVAFRLCWFIFIFLCFVGFCEPHEHEFAEEECLRSVDGVDELPDTLIEGKKFLRRALLLEQPREKVWNVFIKPEEAKSFMPKLKKYEILESHSDSQKVLCVGKPCWFLKTFTCTLNVQLRKPQEISWKQESGDLKSLEGFWKLSEVKGGKTLAVYAIHCDPGMIIPDFIINRAIKRDLTRMLNSVKKRIALIYEGEDVHK